MSACCGSGRPAATERRKLGFLLLSPCFYLNDYTRSVSLPQPQFPHLQRKSVDLEQFLLISFCWRFDFPTHLSIVF